MKEGTGILSPSSGRLSDGTSGHPPDIDMSPERGRTCSPQDRIPSRRFGSESDGPLTHEMAHWFHRPTVTD
jgi:hypothetical protein